MEPPQTTGLHFRKPANEKPDRTLEEPVLLPESRWQSNTESQFETTQQLQEKEREKVKDAALMRTIRTRNKRMVEKYLIFFFVGLEIFFIVNFVFSYTLTGTIFWGIGDIEPDYVAIAAQQRRVPIADRLITYDELRTHDGTDPTLPIYVAIGGKVFDVTSNKKLYAPGGGYHYLAGRDITQAFLEAECTHSKHHECLKSTKLSEEQKKEIQHWIDFFHDHQGYRFIGHLETSAV